MPYINQVYEDSITTSNLYNGYSNIFTERISGDIQPSIADTYISEPVKTRIKELFDEWCGEIVDGKVDRSEIDVAIPLINWHEIRINELHEQVQKYGAKISFLQTQLEELQEQLKYLGFEKLLME